MTQNPKAHHGHHHHHVDPESGDRAVLIAIVINLALTVAQVIGGILSGSVALIADAVHNLSDAASLVIAWAARKIARRPSDETMTFGYRRAELVAALINLTTLVVIAVYLFYEAAQRLISPTEVTGWLMIVVAGVALVVDGATAWLTWRMSKNSVNIRAAFLHNVADALGSVVVILVGVLIVAFGWTWADPVATVMMACYILWMSVGEMRGVIRMLMLGTPPGVSPRLVLAAMQDENGVLSVHHLHVWQLTETTNSLEAHVVLEADDFGQAAQIKAALRARLADEFNVTHVTLEVETAQTACRSVSQIGAD
ncbi:MAG: cation diffusion facilitator family transporter [Maritimibacter sp.]